LCGEFPIQRNALVKKITDAGGVVLNTATLSVNACILGDEGQTFWGYQTGKKSKKYKDFVKITRNGGVGMTYTYEKFLELEADLISRGINYGHHIDTQEEEPLTKKQKKNK